MPLDEKEKQELIDLYKEEVDHPTSLEEACRVYRKIYVALQDSQQVDLLLSEDNKIILKERIQQQIDREIVERFQNEAIELRE